LPKRSAYFNQVRQQHPNVLAVDAGDMMGWQPNAERHRVLFDLVRHLGYDAVGIGDNDFVDGLRFLREMIREYDVPVVSAGVLEAAGRLPFGPAYRVIQIGTVRVGIIGIADPAAFTLMKPDQRSKITTDVPRESLSLFLPKIRREADLILVLSHGTLSHNRTLARRFPDVDVIVGSYSSRPLFEPVIEGETLIVQSGNNGSHVGRLDLIVDDSNQITSYHGWLEPLLESLPDDPEVLGIVEAYRETLRRKAEQVAELMSYEPRYQGETCRPCHEDQYRQWQTTAHAHAFQTLTDAGKDQSPECLFCHTTGYGSPFGYLDQTTTPGLADVQCEICHKVAEQHGQVPSPVAPVSPLTCIKCHTPTQSPEFRYEEAVMDVSH